MVYSLDRDMLEERGGISDVQGYTFDVVSCFSFELYK